MKSCLLKKVIAYEQNAGEITNIKYDEGYVIETTKGTIYLLYETMSASCPCDHGIALVHKGDYPEMHYSLHEYLCIGETATPSDMVLKRLEGFKIKEVNYFHDEDNYWRLQFISENDEFNIIVGKSGCSNGHALLCPGQNVFMYDGLPKQPQLDRISKIFHDHAESVGFERDYWDKYYLKNNSEMDIGPRSDDYWGFGMDLRMR